MVLWRDRGKPTTGGLNREGTEEKGKGGTMGSDVSTEGLRETYHRYFLKYRHT